MKKRKITLVEFILKDGSSIKEEVGSRKKMRIPAGTVKYRFIDALLIVAEGEYSKFIEVLPK